MPRPVKSACLLTVLLILGAFGVLSAEQSESLCEFERPSLKHDYWPVFIEDPRAENETFPVIDVFVNQAGKADRFAVLNSTDDSVKAILSSAARLLEFEPAYACGEVVDGFYRYPVKTYFYVDDRSREEITTIPASIFMMTRDLQSTFELAAPAIDEDQLLFELEITETGKVEKIRGLGSKWARQLGKKAMEEIATRFAFKPALRGEDPVPCRLRLVLTIDESASRRIFEKEASSVFKPMPGRPSAEGDFTGKEYAVELSFYHDGHMKDIQFLTVMDAREALAALAAFRKWRIEPVDGDDSGPLTRTVTYAYTESDETAVLLDESVRPSITRPVISKRVMPEYPRSMLRKGLVGSVEIEIVVDKEGRVQEPEIISATHRDFAASVLKVAPKWRFTPAKLQDEPINSRWRIVIPFRI
jgi:TonB family protein